VRVVRTGPAIAAAASPVKGEKCQEPAQFNDDGNSAEAAQQQQTLGPLIAPVACANLINSRRQYQFQDQRTRRNYGSERGEMSSQKGVFID
jgi:hypothetical protein